MQPRTLAALTAAVIAAILTLPGSFDAQLVKELNVAKDTAETEAELQGAIIVDDELVPIIDRVQAMATVAGPVRTEHPVSSADADDGACPLSIYAKNSANRRLGIAQPSSQVRLRRGWWKGIWIRSNLQVTAYVDPGQTKSFKVTLDFGCDALRRYRFKVVDPSGGWEYLYHPGPSTWTRNNTRFTIDLAKAF